ncbi:MAG: flagellar hook-length control protein FliK [Deltaproteobacteria bacterium]|nr:flagellar hook-length control protein FliK [Deltaproteobacteria bacterium]
MPATIAPTSSHDQVTALRKIAEVPGPTPKPPLELGERLNVLALGDSHNGKTALRVKNFTLLAESPMPLRSGETLTVQVEQLHPTVILRTIPAEPELSKTNEFLKFYRSNPGALKETLVSLKALLGDGIPDPLSRLLSRREMQSLHKMMNQLIISRENITDPLFVKDYVAALGLTGERRVMKAISDPALLVEAKSDPGLKEILLKLSTGGPDVQHALADDESGGLRVQRFSDLAAHATAVIESLQIVNVLAQEQDGLFLLQLPIQFADGIREQEIFVQTEGKKEAPGAQSGCRVVLFLDMDSLGELTADMTLKAGGLHCALKGSDQEVLDFIQPLLSELGRALSEIGYTVEGLECVLDPDITASKREFLQNYSVFTRNAIDVSI